MRGVDMGELSYLALGEFCVLSVMGWFFYLVLCSDSRLAVVALTANILGLFLAMVGHKQICWINIQTETLP
jgi:hypothetical protein